MDRDWGRFGEGFVGCCLVGGCELTRDMEAWRRWEPGQANSQCCGDGCPFTASPLANESFCPTRLPVKSWQAKWQCQQRHFVSWVRTWPPIPELALQPSIVNGMTVRQWALDHGLLSRADLRLHVLYWSNIRSLIKRLLSHNAYAVAAPVHVFDTAFQVRWQCARCQAVGHLRFILGGFG